MDDPADTAAIKYWHAHVYYAPGTRDHAAALREWIEKKFTVRMGRWHEEKVGPQIGPGERQRASAPGPMCAAPP